MNNVILKFYADVRFMAIQTCVGLYRGSHVGGQQSVLHPIFPRNKMENVSIVLPSNSSTADQSALNFDRDGSGTSDAGRSEADVECWTRMLNNV